MDQGATFRRVFTVEYPHATPTWNMMGYTARMHIRTSIASEDIVLAATTENGRITIDDPTELTLEIDAEDTAAIDAGVYVYDIEIESPGGEVIRLVQGSVVVNAEVTR